MPIRPSHLLGFVFAIACAIGMDFLAYQAMLDSFEVPHPAYWTEFLFYYRVAALLGPCVIIGLIFQRRAGFVACGVAAVVCCYLWPLRDMLYTSEGEIALMTYGYFALEDLLYIGLTALVTALVAWLRFKWFPRSRFRAVKLWQIVAFFTLIVTGGRVFLDGARGLYDEHQLSTIGEHAKVTRMFTAMGDVDVVYFKPDVGEEYAMEITAPPPLRERFNRGEEVSIRVVPGHPFVYSWEGEDRSNRILASREYMIAGLVCLGLGMLFGRWLRGWIRKFDNEQLAASNA